jgi:hypothetical protein
MSGEGEGRVVSDDRAGGPADLSRCASQPVGAHPSRVEGWQPIETCDWEEIEVIVCEAFDYRPNTIALAHQSQGEWWHGHPAIEWPERLDFWPDFWICREVDSNPFHLPLPSPPDAA